MDSLTKVCFLQIGAYLSNSDILSASLSCRKLRKKFRPSLAKRRRVVRKREEKDWFIANKHIFDAQLKRREKEIKQQVQSRIGQSKIIKKINKIKYTIYEGYSERIIRKNNADRIVISRFVYGRNNFCAFLPNTGPVMHDAGKMIYKTKNNKLIGQDELKDRRAHYVLAKNNKFYYRKCEFINGEFSISTTYFSFNDEIVRTPAEYIKGYNSCCIIVEGRP